MRSQGKRIAITAIIAPILGIIAKVQSASVRLEALPYASLLSLWKLQVLLSKQTNTISEAKTQQSFLSLIRVSSAIRLQVQKASV